MSSEYMRPSTYEVPPATVGGGGEVGQGNFVADIIRRPRMSVLVELEGYGIEKGSKMAHSRKDPNGRGA